MTFAFIEAEKANFPISFMCDRFGVSRAGFYLWVKRAKNAATDRARLDSIGAKGVETEHRISKELELKALREDNERLRKALFDLMVRHKEL